MKEHGTIQTKLRDNIVTIEIRGYVNLDSAVKHLTDLKRCFRTLNGRNFCIMVDAKKYKGATPEAFSFNNGVYAAAFAYNLKAIALVSDSKVLSDIAINNIKSWRENRDKIRVFNSYIKALNWFEGLNLLKSNRDNQGIA